MPKNPLDLLVEHASSAADMVACVPVNRADTAAEMTRRQLRAALELLIGNGLIRVVPTDEWPEYVVMDPPYRLPGPCSDPIEKTAL